MVKALTTIKVGILTLGISLSLIGTTFAQMGGGDPGIGGQDGSGSITGHITLISMIDIPEYINGVKTYGKTGKNDGHNGLFNVNGDTDLSKLKIVSGQGAAQFSFQLNHGLNEIPVSLECYREVKTKEKPNGTGFWHRYYADGVITVNVPPNQPVPSHYTLSNQTFMCEHDGNAAQKRRSTNPFHLINP